MKVGIITLIIVIFAVACESNKKNKCVVESKKIVRSVYGSGYVKAKKQVLIRAGVSGYVKRIFVEEGDFIEKGKIVAVIDSGGLEEKLKSINERIKLLRKRIKKDSPFRQKLEVNLSIKKENLEKAKDHYLRRKRLFEKGVIPLESLEEAERQYILAQKDYEMALNTLKEKVEEIETELKVMEKEKKALLKELDKYTVRTPISGRVLKKFVDEGEYVNPVGGTNLIAYVGSSDKKVVLEIDEEYLPLIKKGQKVYISSEAFSGKIFEGTVFSTGLRSDPTKRVVEVEVKVNLPESVAVDSVVEGNIIVEILKTTVVPAQAVKNGYVTLLVDGRRRKVKVSKEFKGYAEVLGFPAGTPCLIEE